jgi:hypothetical protein
MIDHLMNILSVVLWGSIGFSLGFLLIRASSNALRDSEESDKIVEAPKASKGKRTTKVKAESTAPVSRPGRKKKP